jgi:peptidoglycan/xylan/chitin deacetylase (PgdA/CDA1 family)
MISRGLLIFLQIILVFAILAVPAEAADRSLSTHKQRTVAVTIDDLPVVRGNDLKARQRITADLLAKIQANRIPAIGFVNEQKLGEPVPTPENIALLEKWLDAGLELGNHTYSHPSFLQTSLEDFKVELTRGEKVTRDLLARRGKSIRYFRHPFLNTGPDSESKGAFESFLTSRGYVVAPVTIDNDEWVYADVYDKAVAAGGELLASKIGADYIRYMEQMFDFYERLAEDLLGREPAQVLLIHANKLNSVYFNQLVEMIRARGYQFVPLKKALEDPAYDLPDEYIGRDGISWLQRWWITRGNERRPEPMVPQWIREASKRTESPRTIELTEAQRAAIP